MPRRKRKPVEPDTTRLLGRLLRDLRRGAGFRSARAAATVPGSPAATQTIYAYERGSLLPTLPQLLDLVEFYADRDGRSPDQSARAVATICAALSGDAYDVSRALALTRSLMPHLPTDGREGAR